MVRYKYENENVTFLKVVSRSSWNIGAPGLKHENPFIISGLSRYEKKWQKVKMKHVALRSLKKNMAAALIENVKWGHQHSTA